MHSALFVIITTLVGWVFYSFPIDIYVSNIFFDHATGFATNSVLNFLHGFVYFTMGVTCSTVMLMILYKFYRLRSFNYRNYLKLIYLLLAFIIGPGLVVNLGLKEHSQRPRPSQTVIYTGSQDYVPPFNFNGNCISNCSFVSGHASVGFMFYAFAFIQKETRRRRLLMLAATVLGAVFGAARIMQGAHYLSDIIFSGVTVFITCYLLAKTMKPEQEQNSI